MTNTIITVIFVSGRKKNFKMAGVTPSQVKEKFDEAKAAGKSMQAGGKLINPDTVETIEKARAL